MISLSHSKSYSFNSVTNLNNVMVNFLLSESILKIQIGIYLHSVKILLNEFNLEQFTVIIY